MTQWWQQWEGARRPWLVLDSGPSLMRRDEFDLTAYSTVTLDGQTPADAAWVSDGATAPEKIAHLAQIAHFLLLPHGPGQSPDAVVSASPDVRELSESGRLVWYDPDTQAAGNSSAAQVISLLGQLGARHIRTLGVDYGPEPTPEAVRAGDGIAAAIQKFNLHCGPLTAEVPARIFIGSDDSQSLGAKILEYSIRRHSTLTTVFDTMQTVHVPMPKDPKNQPRTQFSFSRFAIPALAGYHGRALYLDADMLVFADLRELWELPFGNSTAMYAPPSDPKRPKQTSVMLMDCSRLSWDVKNIVRDLDEGRYDYDGLLRDMRLEPEDAVQPRVPTVWNSLEDYAPARTRLLHYTDMKYQPWVSRRNPHGDLWVEALRDAVAEGFVGLTEVRQAVRDGYIRPSLLWQLRVAPSRWPAFLRLVAPVLDVRYKPHRRLRKRLRRVGM